MNMSGILVVTSSEEINQVCDALNAIEGVEVFHTDESSGRIIVVQEAENVNDEVSGLKRIKKVPGVVMAEMVNHYFGESSNQETMADLPEDIDEMTGLNSVPAFLNE